MNSFTINPTQGVVLDKTTNQPKIVPLLKHDIQAFYHSDYSGGVKWQVKGTFENFFWILKNDAIYYSEIELQNASQQLKNILMEDLPQILQTTGKNYLTVCVIPRAKADNKYRPNQLLFFQTVKSVVLQLNGLGDGTHYIIRHTNTKTTHLRKPVENFVNDGSSPYPGITKDTCTISDNVMGKDILLIDDIYTKTVNIDEDAIQALLDKGANSVLFYAVGKTVSRY